MPRPRKLQYPISFDSWLRLALHKKRLEDRWRIFREWRRWYLRSTLKREPTVEELETEIKEWRKKEFYDSHHNYNLMLNLRLDFLPIYYKENRKNRARSAAIKRWENKIMKRV